MDGKISHVINFLALLFSGCALLLSVVTWNEQKPLEKISSAAATVAILETTSRFLEQLPGQVTYKEDPAQTKPITMRAEAFFENSQLTMEKAGYFYPDQAAIEILRQYGETLKSKESDLFNNAFLPMLTTRSKSLDPSEALGGLIVYSMLSNKAGAYLNGRFEKVYCDPTNPLNLNAYSLSRSNFDGAFIGKNCNFSESDLSDSTFIGSEFGDGLKFKNTMLSNVKFHRIKGEKITFEGIGSGSAQLYNAEFREIENSIDFVGIVRANGVLFTTPSNSAAKINLGSAELKESDLRGVPIQEDGNFPSTGANISWARITEAQVDAIFKKRDSVKVDQDSWALVVSAENILIGAYNQSVSNKGEALRSGGSLACSSLGKGEAFPVVRGRALMLSKFNIIADNLCGG